jgi:phosphocarrier protein
MEASRNIEIINKLGMHARAAAKLVKLATSFESNIDIEKDSRRVNAKSIMGVMMLAASKGSTITLHADGSDAKQSLDALEHLINNRFDEDE